MSTDLSRPLVSASGLHDALDGFITFREAQRAAARSSGKSGAADLSVAIESLSVLCRFCCRSWRFQSRADCLDLLKRVHIFPPPVER
jgi:hypothetical protein